MLYILLSRGYLVQCVILLTYVARIDSTPSVCVTFECDSDKCLPFSSVCDGLNDCLDGTDEGLQCRSATVECVGEHEFLCDDGQCILNALRCDGPTDCMDGSDELRCDIDYVQPFCKEFTCDNEQRCLSLKFLCDGVKQCSDGTDESGHHCSTLSADCSGKDEFLCRNRHCLPARLKCDGSADCVDNSDEEGCLSEKPFAPKVATTKTPSTTLLPYDKLSPTSEMLFPKTTAKETTTTYKKFISIIEKTTKSKSARATWTPNSSKTILVKSTSPTPSMKFVDKNISTKATNRLLTRITSSHAPVTNVIKSNEEVKNNSNEEETSQSKRGSHHMRRMYGGTAVVLIVATVAIIVLVAIRRRIRKRSKPVFKSSIHFINPFYGSA
ncbi:low-density lipoprotein receptor-like [Anneissia japonica]|uniref:low-density lipoprotein receptor-like n=1 Tax=Anneissia japonica TaxID=1529436 RepID=UPI00142572C4|nr:low-density lipoprotein receptor-like [Anneissia japonica]